MSREPFARRGVIAASAALLAGCLGTDDTDAGDEGSDRYTGPMVGETELASDFPVVLEDADTGETAAEVHWHGDGQGEWHYQPVEIPCDGARTFEVSVVDASYDDLDIVSESGYEVRYVPPEDAEPIIEGTIAGDELTIRGTTEGRTDFWLEVRGPGGGSWTTPSLRVRVGANG